MKKRIVCIFLFCLATISSIAGFHKSQPAPAPEKAGESLRIVAYNVGVFSKYQADSMQDVADMMKEIKADAVALCELDSCNLRHSTFQLEDFARTIGAGQAPWPYRFGCAMSWNGGAYGTGIVNASPIMDSYEIKLPKGDGHEPRVCVVAETAEYVIAAVHLDHKNEDVRTMQARILTDELKGRYGRYRKPVFLCGDFNAKPDSRTLCQLAEDWTVLSEQAPTYPSKEPRICIDYVMALKNRARYELVGTAVCTEFESADVRNASDHLPVYVDVRIK
jgi:endonuclease/exonuclease/phosphatase family metal-dependent hydrolase